MTFARYCGMALLAAVLFAGPALAEPAETAKAAGKDASWLAIQTAPQMQFDGRTLTLKNVNLSVVIFANRPVRMADVFPTATFVGSWDKGGPKSFKVDPPNAVLTSIVDGKLQTATVELSDPRLDGTTLTFQVRVIEGTVPTAGTSTSLFIDSLCLTCIG